MAIQVIFQRPAAIQDPAALAIGAVRASESIAPGGTGSLTAQAGEVAYLVNDGAGSDPEYVAHGGTPNASATTATSATSARYPVPAGGIVPVFVAPGDKFAVDS